ncbi:Ribosome production factor 1 [Pleodorina starrii]|uniref:Ribosome production factor 1 n=1 Tax=Pleodorina starrii TaxID=330485 RepID=A0A9W6F1D3_9CHLO|nr:Ribosome production factor 1 [Pleodorina starrii]GLC52664.1 Ribosome production factor 1 [Pleodorina starrii]GLC71671.1 Ribosome production factor 1 [Pleodorina starrii]
MVKAQKNPKRHKSKDDDASKPSSSKGDGERSGDDAAAAAKGAAGGGTIGQQTSGIRNKQKRSELYHKLKHQKEKSKAKERRKRQKEVARAEELGLEPPPKPVQHTLENTREADDTMVDPNDEEVMADENDDEFAAHFSNARPPKVLITTSYKPSKIMYTFLSEMLELLPCAEYYKRNGFPLKKIVKFAANRDYTDLMVFNEDRKQINGLLLVHLPDGPTAHFRLSNLKLGRDIKGHGRATHHKPELILNHFDTRLGHRMGRMLASLFPQDPQFRGRRVVTFHNQRDFIFVRHHRYIFEEKETRDPAAKDPAKKKKKAVAARLQELGPRFTLKLLSLQKGTFDSRNGEFEWLPKKENKTSRRRFFL